jgi:2-phospho-L-lactate/phosphoenolpyruvate guanylyltransferase
VRTLAILPIKGFGSAKQRLGSRLGGGSRRALARAMFSDVLSALVRVDGVERVVVVTRDPEAGADARSRRVVVIDDREEAGQSAATGLGIAYALEEGYERALLVPGDAPLFDRSEVEGLLRRAPTTPPAVTIVPDRHREGTNALLLTPPNAIRPSFGEGSLDRHVALAHGSGASVRIQPLASLAHDVDTPDDLRALEELMASRPGAPCTRGALRQLNRTLGAGEARAAPAAGAGV